MPQKDLNCTSASLKIKQNSGIMQLNATDVFHFVDKSWHIRRVYLASRILFIIVTLFELIYKPMSGLGVHLFFIFVMTQ